MNLGSQSISNQSQGFNDYRYQKALKQISKLINVNRQIKIQSEKYRQQNERVRQQNNNYIEHIKQLQQKNRQFITINGSLQHQLQLLSNEYQNLCHNYEQLEDYCKKTQYQLNLLHTNNNSQQIEHNQIISSSNARQLQQKHTLQINQLQQQYKQQINQMINQIHIKNDQLNELSNQISFTHQLQLVNHKLQQNYQQITKQNQTLKKLNYELKQTNNQLNHKINLLNNQIIQLSTKPSHQNNNQELINKLKINQEWIKSLNQENYNLKQKLLEDQYNKEKQKCNQTILKSLNPYHQFNSNQTNNNTLSANFLSLTNNPNQYLFKQYSLKVQKKIKKIQEEKNHIQHKYSKLKSKNQQLQAQINHLKKQNNVYIIKINGYQDLTKKQQKQIQNMITQYNQQMDKILRNSNKKKIHSTQTLNQYHPNQYTERQNLTPRNNTQTLLKQQSQKYLQLLATYNRQKQLNYNRQKQLQILVKNLQQEIQQCKNQHQQQNKLIAFLQTKINSLESQRTQLQLAIYDLQQQIQMQQNQKMISSSSQNMDLSKTSKNYHSKPQQSIKPLQLIKPIPVPNFINSQSMVKNGNKVFIINGKKYETKVLKSNNQSSNIQNVYSSNNNYPNNYPVSYSNSQHSNSNNYPNTFSVNQNILPSQLTESKNIPLAELKNIKGLNNNTIEYISTQRSYNNQPQYYYPQRA